MTGDTGHDSGPISRRRVLAGLGAVGVTGAFGGVGTLGKFADTESVTGKLQAGTLDLELCWEDGSDDCDPRSSNTVVVPISVSEDDDTGSARIRYHLPDDTPNNPGYVWFRTSCPVDACGLERALDVTLWQDTDCDGDTRDETIVTQGRLCDVLASLHDGVLLDGDTDEHGADPLQPGEERCFGIEWQLTDSLCAPDSIEIAFQFRAEQARRTMSPASPWTGATCAVDCDDTGDCVACLDEGGISFVAFCGPDRIGNGDLTLTTTAYNYDREPVAFDWACTKQVDSVVLKLGNAWADTTQSTGGEFALYEFTGFAHIDDRPGGGSRGSVLSGDGDLVIDGEPWNPCPGGTGLKYEIGEDAWERV